MSRQQPQPLVYAFSGRPPNPAMVDLAHDLAGGVSRENVGKIMAAASAHHIRARMPTRAQIFGSSAPAPRTTSFAKSVSPRRGPSLGLSSFFGGTQILRNTGYTAAPRLSFNMSRNVAPAPRFA